MFNKFKTDLNNAKEAEKIVREVLQCMTDNYCFTDVSDAKECWHLGDIEVNHSYCAYCDRYDINHMYDSDCNQLSYEEFEFNNSNYFIDVKDDKRIGDTGNILCEERVYYRKYCELVEGFMYSHYDYLAVVSKKEKRIYILDFHLLQKHYRQGRKIRLSYTEQWSDVYLYSLDKAKENGILLVTIEYENDNNNFYPLDLVYKKDNLIINTY